MNDPNPPLSAETLDELVSADIDGELDRAATELGLTPEEARAAIAAAPAALTRRRALEAARDLFSTQPALDPAAAAQLVASAVAAAAPVVVPIRSRRAPKVWRALVGAAAAAAVVAGIVAVAATNPGSESKSSLAPGAASAKSGASDTPLSRLPSHGSVAFGDVSRPQSLRARVGYELRRLNNAPLPQAAAVVPSGTTSSEQLEAPTVSARGATFNSGSGSSKTKAELAAGRAALRACISQVAAARHLRGTPLVAGAGTFHSRPVYVVVFRESGINVAYVLAAADCSVVARDTLP